MLSLCTPGSSVNLSGFGIPICKMHFKQCNLCCAMYRRTVTVQMQDGGWTTYHHLACSTSRRTSQSICAARRSSQWLKEKILQWQKKAKSALLHLDTQCAHPSPLRDEHFENRPGGNEYTTCTNICTHTPTSIPAIWAKTRGKVNLWSHSCACHCCSRNMRQSSRARGLVIVFELVSNLVPWPD